MLLWGMTDAMNYLKPLHCFEKTKESVGKKSLKKLLHITGRVLLSGGNKMATIR